LDPAPEAEFEGLGSIRISLDRLLFAGYADSSFRERSARMGKPESGVTLRQATVDDAELILAWRNEPTTKRYQPILERSLDEVRQMLRKRADVALSPDADGEMQWVIEADTVPAGWITLRVVSRLHGVGELGYTLGRAFHRRGYMSAAVRQLLPLAFDPAEGANLWRLEAIAAVQNVASRTVLERAGFQFEGVARASLIINGERVDHARYALLRPDWHESVSGGASVAVRSEGRITGHAARAQPG
jgi:ribosomal-protein-alanine N-acetyltransferase